MTLKKTYHSRDAIEYERYVGLEPTESDMQEKLDDFNEGNDG